MFNIISKVISNLKGYHTSRKIVVMEVDDYGTTQYHDLVALSNILKLKNELPYFYQHDRLESFADLSRLFEVLTSVKDKEGNYAVMTPLTVMTNPDKEKINKTGQYHYEIFSESIQRIHGKNTWELWMQGVGEGIFMPEYHGREHLNTDLWIEKIFTKNHKLADLFNKGIFVYVNDDDTSTPPYRFFNESERLSKLNALEDGLRIFKRVFDRPAVSYTPPAGAFSYGQESILHQNGIQAIQLGYEQQVINEVDYKNTVKYHYFGQQSSVYPLFYMPRNAVFEPHSELRSDCVNHCLSKIDLAFKLKKPAIISSHRVNFIENGLSHKIKGLEKLNTLLKQIVKRWPDVEFMSSSTLIKEIALSIKN